jgi:N-acetylmuramoyl-L-alanine amidase
MKIVYPLLNHTLAESSTFVLGSLSSGLAPQETLWIYYPSGRKDAIEVSHSGFFAWKIQLEQEGENIFHLKHLGPNAEEKDIYGLTIIKESLPPPFVFSEDLPITVESLGLTTGNAPFILMKQDTLILRCLNEPGLRLKCHIEGESDVSFLLQAMSDEGYIDNKTGIFGKLYQVPPRYLKQGVYTGALPMESLLQELSCEATQRLHSETEKSWPLSISVEKQGHPKNQIIPLESTLTLWTTPRIGKIKPPKAIVRTLPELGARLTPFLQDSLVTLVGAQEGWFKVEIDPGNTCWIAMDDVEILENQTIYQPFSTLRLVDVLTFSPSHAQLRMPVENRVPLHFEATTHSLTLTFSYTASCCDFIHFHPMPASHPPERPALVQNVEVTQSSVSDQSCLTLTTNHPITGYDYGYEEEEGILICVVNLKSLPLQKSETLILIDPGHGGDETGATGLDGTPEKEINLALALKLKNALEEQGFATALTRTEDVAVSLNQRVEWVKEHQAHMVLSLHHNALPDGANPLSHQGPCSFYYQPFSKPLAQCIQNNLVSHCKLNNYGLLYTSFFMTRIHEALAVLIEVGFVTHPEDYERMIQPSFQEQEALAIANSIHQYWLNFHAKADAAIS